MRRKAILALGLAVALGGMLPTTAAAAPKMITSQPVDIVAPLVIPGPTRYNAVPRAEVLQTGVNLFSTNLMLGASPGLIGGRAMGVNLGITANALDMRADMGIGPNFELGTGIAYLATSPWVGQLNMTGKWGLTERLSPLSVAGIGGVALTTDPNGIVNIGLVVGMPLTRSFMLGSNPLMLTVAPHYNIGWNSSSLARAPGAIVSNLGLGLGGSYGITDNLFALADSNLGFPTAGLISDSSLGLRYAITPSVTADLFLGIKAIPANIAGRNSSFLSSLGVGTSWQF